jgi:sulfate permease, SulP family
MSAGHPQYAVTTRRRRIADLIAGISVALILVPQSLAYAELAGMPAHRGLYAGALPALAAAFFASSPYLQAGPTAITSLLTFAVLSSHAVPGTDAYIGMAALLALVVAAVRLAIGLSKSGAISYLMSQPVVRGFSTAAALLITASQIPALLGAAPADGGVIESAARTLWLTESWSTPAIGVGVVTLGLLLIGRRLHALFPGVLIAAVLGTVFAALTDYPAPTIGHIPETLPPFSLDLPWARVPSLLVSGVVIALIGFAEVAAISQTFAEKTRRPWNPDREFISQAAANLASGVSGGFPVGGSFSRSSLARLAGAQTRMSGAVAGIAVLLFLPAAGILASLPKAVLGAAVIASVLSLLDPRPLVRMWSRSPLQATIGWITFAATLLLSPHIEYAVILGIGVAVAVHLWREHRVDVEVSAGDGTIVIRPMGVLWFGSAPVVRQKLVNALADYPPARRLDIDVAGVGRLDLTGAAMLADVAEHATEAGLEVRFIGVPPAACRIMERVCAEVAPFERRATEADDD